MKVVSNAKHVWMIYKPDNSHVAIVPGVNLNVDDSIKDHPDFKKRVELGLIVVSETNKGFKEMETKDLINDIRRILDVKVLEKILHEDERVAVQKAAQDQMDKIRKGEPSKKAKDSE